MSSGVAITGMGVVTAQGVGVERTWEGVVNGRDVLEIWRGMHGLASDHPLLRLKVAQCPELPRPGDLPARLWGKLSRTQQLACVAVDEALTGAGLPRNLGDLDSRTGVFLATTVCGMDVSERFYAQYRQNKAAADPELMRRLQPYEVGDLIARRHGVDWSRSGIVPQVCLTTCVGSAMAIASAADAIALGECDLAIAGGSEALCRVVLSGFHALKVVAADGCRPFDRDRPGMTVGEGAGILVLESAPHARARGAQVLAHLRGVGMTCDGFHLTAPEPDGKQAARAMRQGLERAVIKPDEIDYVHAHGTGTRDNDATEMRAIRAVFCSDRMPLVSSTKRCTGHTFGAAAAIEGVLCVQALREGIAPVNSGSVQPDSQLDLAIVRGQSLRRDIRAAMCTNLAFGGNNTAMVFSREEGP